MITDMCLIKKLSEEEKKNIIENMNIDVNGIEKNEVIANDAGVGIEEFLTNNKDKDEKYDIIATAYDGRADKSDKKALEEVN